MDADISGLISSGETTRWPSAHYEAVMPCPLHGDFATAIACLPEKCSSRLPFEANLSERLYGHVDYDYFQVADPAVDATQSMPFPVGEYQDIGHSSPSTPRIAAIIGRRS